MFRWFSAHSAFYLTDRFLQPSGILPVGVRINETNGIGFHRDLVHVDADLAEYFQDFEEIGRWQFFWLDAGNQLSDICISCQPCFLNLLHQAVHFFFRKADQESAASGSVLHMPPFRQ